MVRSKARPWPRRRTPGMTVPSGALRREAAPSLPPTGGSEASSIVLGGRPGLPAAAETGHRRRWKGLARAWLRLVAGDRDAVSAPGMAGRSRAATRPAPVPWTTSKLLPTSIQHLMQIWLYRCRSDPGNPPVMGRRSRRHGPIWCLIRWPNGPDMPPAGCPWRRTSTRGWGYVVIALINLDIGRWWRECVARARLSS